MANGFGGFDDRMRRQILARALMGGGAGILQGAGQGMPTAGAIGMGAQGFLSGLDQMTMLALRQQAERNEQILRDERLRLLREQIAAMQEQRQRDTEQRRRYAELAESLPEDLDILQEGVRAGDPRAMQAAFEWLNPSQLRTGPGGSLYMTGPGGRGVESFTTRAGAGYPFGDFEAKEAPPAPAEEPKGPGMLSRFLKGPPTLEAGLQQRAGREAAQMAAAGVAATRARAETLMHALGTGSRIRTMTMKEAEAALAVLDQGYPHLKKWDKKVAETMARKLRERIVDLEEDED